MNVKWRKELENREKKQAGRRRGFKFLVLAWAVLVSLAFGGMSALAEEGASHKTVRISCGVNELLYFDGEGNVTGYCKEYIERLAEINGWECQYVKCNWSEGVQMLEDGRIEAVGSHEQLLQTSLTYQKLFKEQLRLSKESV